MLRRALSIASLLALGRAPVAIGPLLALAVVGSWQAGCATRVDPAVEELHRAVLRGDVAAVERVLAANPRLAGARDEDGLSALHLTAVRLRMAPDAVEAPAGTGSTAGHGDVACAPRPVLTSYDRKDVARHLLRTRRAGAPTGGADAGDDVHLGLTTTLERRPMTELLIRHGADVNARTRLYRLTPLHFAVRMGHKGVAEALLERGADVLAADSTGLTALGMVAQSGNTALARVLLDRGAPIDRRMPRGMVLPVFADDTPLALAILCNQYGMVALLLERGANPNLAIRDGFRPLHLVDRAAIAELLLEHGAELEGRGHEGRTPLHQAAMQSRLPVLRSLLDRGADPNSRDDKGQTPLLLALSQRSTAEVIDALVRRGAAVNVTDGSGRPALHAALDRDRAIVVLLLDAGAPIDAQDRYGRTLLHLAVESNDVELVEQLLARGASVNVRDMTRHTPLYYAWGGTEEDERIAAVLERHGGVR